MSLNEFKAAIKEASLRFNGIDRKETIKIISHIDADGISAASIIVKLMNYLERVYALSIVPQLDSNLLKAIANEKYNVFIFSDLGAANIEDIKELFKSKIVFILDHHKLKSESKEENIIHINPHLYGIDGNYEISGAGVSYLFCKEIDSRIIEMSTIALVGAVGDIQENNGFSELNNGILKDAISANRIKMEKGIKFIGYKKRALHKILEYCNDIDIPGVCGDERGAINFLQEIGIYDTGNGWKGSSQLNERDVNMLAQRIIQKTGNKYTKEEIICNNYIILNEKNDALKELREFSTVLNACGRMKKAGLGVGACLGDEKAKEKAIALLEDYRREIMKAMDWFNQNRKTANVIEEKGYLIINAKDRVLGTIIGTIASMISNSSSIKEGTYIMSTARLIDGKTKVSLRVAGRKQDADLAEIIKDIIGKAGFGEYGGHKYAAGALIPTDKEDKFLEIAKEVLEKRSMEEGVK